MMIFDCIKMPAIYVRDYCTKCIHMVGTNEHDRLYLDDDGHIQYFNLQNGCGTPDEYDFVLDPEGHDQNNLPFTEEEQIMYGLSNMDAYFGGVDLKKAQSLTERAEKTKEETNFEHFFEYLSTKRMSDFALIDGRITQCSVTRCSKCDFNNDCIEGKFTWLKQPYEKPKYKLTQFEYDLIKAFDLDNKLDHVIDYIAKLERENLGLKEYKKHQERANERRYRSGEESWHRGSVVAKKK